MRSDIQAQMPGVETLAAADFQTFRLIFVIAGEHKRRLFHDGTPLDTQPYSPERKPPQDSDGSLRERHPFAGTHALLALADHDDVWIDADAGIIDEGFLVHCADIHLG